MQNGLTQVVNLPTCGNNCIDLVMVSDVVVMLDVDPFAISCDHSSVEFLVPCPSDLPSNSISYEDYSVDPWLLQDIRSVERVQRFFTRAIFKRVKLSTMSYADHLLHLGFHSLEYRRVFSDLLMCFKIVKNLVDLDASAFFHINLSPYGTRPIKLSPVSTPRHNFRSNFFSVRIINNIQHRNTYTAINGPNHSLNVLFMYN